MVIIAEKKEKTASNFKTQMANVKTNEEKRAAIDTLLEDLSSWYSPFQPGFLKDNYGPGEKPEVEHFAGLRISFTVSEDYRPIFNKAALYRQANCAED